jgi:hypothetical protein
VVSDSNERRLLSPRELQELIRADRAGLPYVWWREGGGELHLLTLPTNREQVTVGRRQETAVALTWDAEVSRLHAYLELVGGDWTLVDDGMSRNGSFVNGNRVRGRVRLHHKDRLCFGNTYVHFHDPAQEHDSSSTARAPGSPSGQLSEIQRKVLVALCRPIIDSSSATPATNPQIAAEVHLSVDAVKAHLRILFERYGLGDLPQNEKRSRLVSTVLDSGLLLPHEF